MTQYGVKTLFYCYLACKFRTVPYQYSQFFLQHQGSHPLRLKRWSVPFWFQ